MSMAIKHIVWHEGEVSAKLRKKHYGHPGLTVWLTGLSGSGKSTIAMRTERLLIEQGVKSYALDGDNLRHGLNSDLDFTATGRQENIRRIGEVCRLFCDAGIVVLAAFISPYEKDRQTVRNIHPEKSFIEVHVATPLAVCESRDPKGLYKKARAGELKNFTGISAPYEEPSHPDLVLDTTKTDIDDCAKKLVSFITSHLSQNN
ncbi:MAG: adenylyl-sulfate kinase [Myxococcales bacterium]|nr:MAG: adenylyl-sulfate kinase [Myxococcales bacterium]